MALILETEEDVQIPHVLYSDPFYRITYLIKKDIRKWEQARQEWTEFHGEVYEKFLINILSFPDTTSPKESRGGAIFAAGNMLAALPHRTGG
jgi:hypothetical protein